MSGVYPSPRPEPGLTRRLTMRVLLGLALLALLLAVALLGDRWGGHDALSQDLGNVRAAPSAAHWLGTDPLGRDQLARLSAALRLSLGGALAAVLLAAGLGCTLGGLAAWCGGWVDRVLALLADAASALPGLLLVLLVAVLAPGELLWLYLGLAASMWVEYFRVVRAQASRLLASPQVEAAQLLGFGPAYVVRYHLLPPLAPVLGTLMAFGVSSAVLALAALGFVGVGLQPPEAELGVMLIELLPYYAEAPWLLAAPIAALVLLLLALVLLAGDEDPR